MKFEEFKAAIDYSVIIWADDTPSGRTRFLIDRQILTGKLGIKDPVHDDENVRLCESQREKIEDACERAYERQPSDRVTLTDIDFTGEGDS
jgi:hypothetical protein